MDAKRDYQNYTTVLEMVNSVSNDSSVIAFGDQFSALFNAEDRPPRQREYFYFILSDGIRKDVEGAQEYYNSIISLYAGWGVDFIKCDDICNPTRNFQEHESYQRVPYHSSR